MKSNQRTRNIQITDKLTLGANAIVRKKVGNDYAIILSDQTHEVLTTTKALTAEDSGKTFILNTITAFATTLPAPLAGLRFKFIIGAIEPTTSHTIVTNASANIIQGNLTSPDVDGTVVVTAADADTISFIASKALHGDFASVWSDGTYWYVEGMCKAFDGMTTTQAS